METSNLIKKTFINMLIVNAISMVSGIVCVMVDSIVTGQFLGAQAVTAVGILTPITMLINIFGVLFGPGLGIVCTRYVGMAKPERVVEVFSVVITTLVIMGTCVAIGLFITAPFISNLLGGKVGNQHIINMTTNYLRGFSFGILPMCLSMPLSGLMMLDNDKMRSIAAMFATLIADIVFDLANVTIFHGGMWGMAIATALSQVVGLSVVLTHFLRKERILRYNPKNMHISDLKEVILCGIANVISMGSQAVRGIIFNFVLLSVATGSAVAALSACNSAFAVIIAVALSMFVTTSTICSLLYGEEDRKGLYQAIQTSLHIVIPTIFVISAVMFIFAGGIAGFFLDKNAVEELSQAARFIRFMAVQMLFNSISYSLSGAYQGTRRLNLIYTIILLREGVFQIICVVVLGLIFGLHGVEIGILLSGVLIAVTCLIIPAVVNKRFSVKPKDLILLRDDFGPKPNELFESSVNSMDGVMEASNNVMDFCKQNGVEKKKALQISLFIEEMAGNTVQYGFEDNQKGNVDIRLICRDNEQMIRIRDNGKPFDPLEWFKKNAPDDPVAGIGIRMIVKLSKDVQYIPAMGLNNLVIKV
ncbi:MAG: ATP-binding protein [Lachnospiraceae bacterium]|nr:ATP-binding protein [Lachnospiraceae bacterium]